VVVIAHRLSTAERSDLVGVVDGGHLVELGTHAELVAAGGAYSRLYETWTAAGNGNGVGGDGNAARSGAGAGNGSGRGNGAGAGGRRGDRADPGAPLR
jgi:ATP-binding cassette, subfamily B, bacterial